jgi:Fur family transcriptional regulator, ferric uptake regulator
MDRPQLVKDSAASERSSSWLQSLRNNGYRLTASRRAVVGALAESKQSVTPADLFALGRARHKQLGLVTVYRTLEKLEELGLVQRVHHPEGCHAYISGLEGHQHLLLCESCGRVEIFHGDNLKDFSQHLEGESGFEIRDHWLQFFGLCSQCH